MEADYDIFEIVAVIRDFCLIDAESYQRSYSTRHGQPMAPGYYVVKWPEHIRARRFNEHATFHGPFKLSDEAQATLKHMHKEWERVLTLASGISSTTTRNSSQIALPLATKAKVIKLEKAKMVEDKSNGRKSHTKDRVIEPSHAAAK